MANLVGTPADAGEGTWTTKNSHAAKPCTGFAGWAKEDAGANRILHSAIC